MNRNDAKKLQSARMLWTAVAAAVFTTVLTSSAPAALVVTYTSSSTVTGGGTPPGDGGTPPVDGGTMPVDGGTPPVDGGSPPDVATQYTYTVTFTPSVTGETLTSGSYLTLYDVGNVMATVSSTDFTTSEALIGNTPAQTTPADSADVNNLTLTYTGADLTTETTFTLSLTTPGTSGTQLGTFTSSDTLLGSNFSLIGPVLVPSAVPEPATLATIAIGLGSLLGRRWRTR